MARTVSPSHIHAVLFTIIKMHHSLNQKRFELSSNFSDHDKFFHGFHKQTDLDYPIPRDVKTPPPTHDMKNQGI